MPDIELFSAVFAEDSAQHLSGIGEVGRRFCVFEPIEGDVGAI